MVTVEFRANIDFSLNIQPNDIATRFFKQVKTDAIEAVRTARHAVNTAVQTFQQTAITAAQTVRQTTAKAVGNTQRTVAKAARIYGDAAAAVFDAIFGSKAWMKQHPEAFTLRLMLVGATFILGSAAMPIHNHYQNEQLHRTARVQWYEARLAEYERNILRHDAALDTQNAVNTASDNAREASHLASVAMENANHLLSIDPEAGEKALVHAHNIRSIANALQTKAEDARQQLAFLIKHDETLEQALAAKNIAETAAHTTLAHLEIINQQYLLTSLPKPGKGSEYAGFPAITADNGEACRLTLPTEAFCGDEQEQQPLLWINRSAGRD